MNLSTKLLKIILILVIPLLLLADPNIIESPTNTLIRSGNLIEIENDPIYLNDGITYSIGGIGNIAFDVTARLQDALIKLDSGQNPAVNANWNTTEEYEEWTDRLIIKKTTNFFVLDGSRFAETFNTLDNHFNTNSDYITQNPINLPEINEMVQEYIDSGEHLNLYDEASIAGNLGVDQLISELKQDRGPITIIETIEFSRIVKEIENPDTPSALDILVNEPIEGAEVITSKIASIKDSRSDYFEPSTLFSDDSEGITSYSQKMLNGFTVGNEWSKSITYDRRWFYVHTSAFAGFGLGIRIPWTADVEVSKKIIPRNDPDRTNYEASIKVETLDADTHFYRSVGVPASHRYQGKELPLEAGAGITLKIKLFNHWIIKRGTDDPVVGKVINMSQDFDPPLGPTPMPIACPHLLYEDSGLAYYARFAGVGGDFKADIGIRGDSIDLRVRPYNSWNRNGSEYSKSFRNISLNNELSPVSLSFSIDDSSAGSRQYFYNFGPIYDQASYNTSLTITPKARIRGTIYLSELWSALSDINITSNWHSLFTAAFSLPSLGPHAGVESKLEAIQRSKRLLPITMQINPNRFSVNPSTGIWDFIISDLGSQSLVIKEYIPDGFDLVIESITHDGIYDEVEKTITWNIDKDIIPEDVSYRCYSILSAESEQNLTPKPIGSFEYLELTSEGNSLIEGAIQDFRYESMNEAEADLARYKFSKRPSINDYNSVIQERDSKLTLEEVKDLRAGSKMIQVENGQATISMQLEESEDLDIWTNGGASTFEIPVDSNEGTKFYRFKFEE